MNQKEIKATIKEIKALMVSCSNLEQRRKLADLESKYTKLLASDRKLQRILRKGE